MALLLCLLIVLSSPIVSRGQLSGSYTFDGCSCTVLQCPPRFSYEFSEPVAGDLRVTYRTYLAAQGKVLRYENGRRLEVTLQWLPGMDFDTACTGVVTNNQRSIELRCGDQLRGCSGRFQLLESNDASRRRVSPLAVIVFFVLLLAAKINKE